MGTSSFGTLLKIGDGNTGSETFATIAEVKDISGPGLALDTEESTSQSSPGGFEEVLPSILRTGEVTFTVNFIPGHATQSNASGLLRDLRLKTLRNFQLVFPVTPSVTWGFGAYVTKFEPAAPVKGVLTASISLKITGQPTLA